MIQCLKHKAKERPEKRRGNKVNELLPPHLEQPGQRRTADTLMTHKCHICCNSPTLMTARSLDQQSLLQTGETTSDAGRLYSLTCSINIAELFSAAADLAFAEKGDLKSLIFHGGSAIASSEMSQICNLDRELAVQRANTFCTIEARFKPAHNAGRTVFGQNTNQEKNGPFFWSSTVNNLVLSR